MENEEILQALSSFEQEQDFSKLKRSLNNLLRFVKTEGITYFILSFCCLFSKIYKPEILKVNP